MMKLYYASGACSMAVHVLLNEVGASFEAIKVDLANGQQRTPEFLAINPRGQIPVLVDGDLVLREGAAILEYIAQKFNSPMMPSSGQERAKAMEAMMFCNATLHPAYGRVFFLNKQNIDAGAKASLLETACAAVQKLWDDVEATLNKNRYVAGETVIVADIMLAVMANWSMPHPVVFGVKTKALINEVVARPSYQQAITSEGVTYKAAA